MQLQLCGLMGRQLLRTYNELIQLDSWEERLDYLKLTDGKSYDSPRFMNQSFYKSPMWRNFKRDMHLRDNGMDLGVMGVYIYDRVILHHINPVTIEDLETMNLEILLNPNNVITTSGATHNKIHYSKKEVIPEVIRQPGDTKLW